MTATASMETNTKGTSFDHETVGPGAVGMRAPGVVRSGSLTCTVEISGTGSSGGRGSGGFAASVLSRRRAALTIWRADSHVSDSSRAICAEDSSLPASSPRRTWSRHTGPTSFSPSATRTRQVFAPQTSSSRICSSVMVRRGGSQLSTARAFVSTRQRALGIHLLSASTNTSPNSL